MKVKRSVLLTKRFLFLLAGLVGVTVLLQCSIFVLLSIYKIAGSCCFKIDEGTIRNQAKLSKWVVPGALKSSRSKRENQQQICKKKNGQKKLFLEIKDKFYSTKVVPAFLLGVLNTKCCGCSEARTWQWTNIVNGKRISDYWFLNAKCQMHSSVDEIIWCNHRLF